MPQLHPIRKKAIGQESSHPDSTCTLELNSGRPTTTLTGASTTLETGKTFMSKRKSNQQTVGADKRFSNIKNFEYSPAKIVLRNNMDALSVDGVSTPTPTSSHNRSHRGRYASTGRVGGMQGRGNKYINLNKFCIAGD